MRLYTLSEVLEDRQDRGPIYTVINHKSVLYVGQTRRLVSARLIDHCSYGGPSNLGGYIQECAPDSPSWHVLTLTVEEIEVNWGLISIAFCQAPLWVKERMYERFTGLSSHDERGKLLRRFWDTLRIWGDNPPSCDWWPMWTNHIDNKPPVDRAETFLIMLHQPPLNTQHNPHKRW